MSARLSRRTLATYAAERLLAGDSTIIDELAALLIEERRTREADLLAADIEYQLAERGELVVTVETARPLAQSARHEIEAMFSGKTVHIREIIEPALIGGFRMMTPSQLLDATIASRLASLRTMKV